MLSYKIKERFSENLKIHSGARVSPRPEAQKKGRLRPGQSRFFPMFGCVHFGFLIFGFVMLAKHSPSPLGKARDTAFSFRIAAG